MAATVYYSLFVTDTSGISLEQVRVGAVVVLGPCYARAMAVLRLCCLALYLRRSSATSHCCDPHQQFRVI